MTKKMHLDLQMNTAGWILLSSKHGIGRIFLNISKILIVAEEYREDFRLKPKDIELTEVRLEAPTGFGKYLNRFMSEDMEALSFGVKGLRVNANKFTNWLKEQGEGGVEGIVFNLGLGIGIQKTLDFIARASHLSPHGERVMDFWVTEGLAGLQLSLSSSEAGVVIGIGVLLAMPVIKLVDFLTKSGEARRKKNDTPESVYGTQFARVRSQDENGVVTWYPGILASKDLWTGIGSREQNIRINYGKLEDLFWRFNKDGTFSPYFRNVRYRMINAKDVDLVKHASESQRMKYDPLRDYSLFTLKDTAKMFSTLVQGKDMSDFKETVDDRSKLPKYLQELISYRDDFEWVRKFNTGDEKIGRHLNPADRSIRREFEHSLLSNPDLTFEGQKVDPTLWKDMMSDDKYKDGFTKHKGALHENKALLSFFHARMTDLLRSQKIAAEETPAFLESLKNIGKFDDMYNYTLYALDTGTKPANSLDELKLQVSQTQARDLTWYEKNYLQQKQIVRYFAKKLSNRALGSEIVDNVTYPWQNTYYVDAKNKNTALNYRGLLSSAGTFRLKQVGHTSVMGNPPGPWSDSYEKTIPKWLYDGKYMRHIRNTSKKEDYIEASEKLHTLMQEQFVAPGLLNVKFKPGKAFLDSNPFVHEIRKDKGDIGHHRYDRKGERLFEETAEEKSARLAKIKQARLLTMRKRPLPKKVKTLFKDPTLHDRTQKPANVSWEKRFGKMENKWRDSQYQKKKSTKSQQTQQEKQRYFDRIRSSEQERITSDKFAKKRKHHGMNYYEYHEFIRDHAGKTPDEVFKQGQWKVAKNGTPTDVNKVPVKEKQTVIPKVPVKPKVSDPADPYSALREYIREQHNINIPKNMPITQKQFPWLAMTQAGKPALFGDAVLHDKLKLGDAFRVVTSKTGIVHTAYDPSKVQPKFFKQHETSVVRSY